MKTAYSCLLSSLISLACSRLPAATFTVTTTNISGPGSLPVVINQANASSGHNIVQFGVTNVLTLAFSLATITNGLTIVGRTDVPTVISGGGTLPIFSFAAGTTNVLSHLVLINGNTSGGGAAINNAGTLSVSTCVITNHSALSGFGGAISNGGVLTIASSSISDSMAASGGAIYNAATMTVANSQLSANQAGNGAAIYNAGSLALKTVTILSNHATLGFGGGLYNSGSSSINASTLSGNSATGGAGGSGYDVGGGGGAGLGGAIFSLNGNVSITNSTIAGNTALGGAGGNAMLSVGSTNATAKGGGNNPGNYLELGSPDGGFGGGGGGQRGYAPYFGGYGGFGGGGGGIGPIIGGNGGFGGGTANGVNTYGNGGGGGAGIGAGVFVEGGMMSFVNCTVAFNQATGGAGGQVAPQGMAGNGGQGIGGGIFNHSGTITLLNTIIANNIAQNTSADLYGTFATTGFNLIGNNQGATNLSINDFQNVEANLGPLQDNGGPTLTCAPLQGSLAIGYGTSVGAPGTDQRGVPRPQGAAVDIGAVEVVTTSPVITGAAMLTGSGFDLKAIFDATNSYRVQGSTNLRNWDDLTNYVGGGSHSFVDTTATNLNRRFYRTSIP